MSQVTNTYESYDLVGKREELADRIYMITPAETPFLSLIGRKPVKSTHPEWQVDDLAAIDPDNNRMEGAEWNFDALSPTVRVGNYCQISDKRLIVSRTADDVSKAGRKKEMARELAKKGKEIKTDMEIILLSNQASHAGAADGATNRKLGGFRAWLATNDSLGAGGASGGFNSGTAIVDAATNGTQRAFTKAILDEIILAAYNAGGSPDVFMCSPYVKTVFSGFMDGSDVAQPRVTYGKKKNAIIASADVYVSDFGDVDIVPNRQFARAGASYARNGFLIDASMVHMGVFHDISVETPAKTGDATKKVLVTEYTLVVPNEKAHAVAADLYGMTASS